MLSKFNIFHSNKTLSLLIHQFGYIFNNVGFVKSNSMKSIIHIYFNNTKIIMFYFSKLFRSMYHLYFITSNSFSLFKLNIYSKCHNIQSFSLDVNHKTEIIKSSTFSTIKMTKIFYLHINIHANIQHQTCKIEQTMELQFHQIDFYRVNCEQPTIVPRCELCKFTLYIQII